MLSEAISDSFHCKYEINLGDHAGYSGEKPENFNSIPSYLDYWEEAGENEVEIYLEQNPSLDDGEIFMFLKAVKENRAFPEKMFRQFVLVYPDGTVITVDATQ